MIICTRVASTGCTTVPEGGGQVLRWVHRMAPRATSACLSPQSQSHFNSPQPPGMLANNQEGGYGPRCLLSSTSAPNERSILWFKHWSKVGICFSARMEKSYFMSGPSLPGFLTCLNWIPVGAIHIEQFSEELAIRNNRETLAAQRLWWPHYLYKDGSQDVLVD